MMMTGPTAPEPAPAPSISILLARTGAVVRAVCLAVMLFVALATFAAQPGRATAILVEQAPIVGQGMVGNGAGASSRMSVTGGSGAQSFSLRGDAVLSEVSLAVAIDYVSYGFERLEWSVRRDESGLPGEVVAGGSARTLSAETAPDIPSTILAIYLADFDLNLPSNLVSAIVEFTLPELRLDAGKYWLALRAGDSEGGSGTILWLDGRGTAASSFQDAQNQDWQLDAGSRAFRLSGVRGAEGTEDTNVLAAPDTVALLGLGLLALALGRRYMCTCETECEPDFVPDFEPVPGPDREARHETHGKPACDHESKCEPAWEREYDPA
jgi:hypothetical protein